MEGDLCLTMSIFGNQDALPDVANRAWLPGRRALPTHPSSCHSPPEAEYSQMSYPSRYPAKAAWQAGGRRSRKRKLVERGCL